MGEPYAFVRDHTDDLKHILFQNPNLNEQKDQFMTETIILHELQLLSETQKKEVLQFIQFLKWKQKLQEAGAFNGEISVEDNPFAALDLIYEKDLQALESIAGVKIKR